jgi:transcriptional regulator with GAF, ATPase, and Fis domain
MIADRPTRVLILEDNDADARLLVEELRLGGLLFETRQARSESEYVAELSWRPEVILADYTLPGFDAAAALRLLHERALAVPFIVVTGTVGEERAVECMRAGATDYLLKDRLARLSDAVRRAIDEQAERAAKRSAEAALHERLRFEALCAAVSTRLIHAGMRELDSAVVEVLRAVGEFLHFERTLVMLLDGSRERFLMSHEWCAPGVPSFSRATSGLPIAEFGWPLEQIRDGETMVLIRDQLPDFAKNARMVMEKDSLSLLATLPLRLEGNVIGCIGFHQRRPEHVSPDLIGRLNLLSEIVVNALARKRAEERRQAVFEELERLKRAAEEERDYLREELAPQALFADIVGGSGALRRALEMVDAVASTKATVLIHGESGTGKELIAHAIHGRSTRAAGPLVKVNCASVPKELFESEFFGHVRGAFTGAQKDRVGRFELADGGSIFLDEVGELPLEMQSKLLRVLQESEFERVGDDRTRRVDVRVIAATNRNLEAEVARGTFRADLYYRLSVFPIEVPPLRARKEDIVSLAEFFLRRYCRELGRTPPAFGAAEKDLLVAYDWPGNVRELENVVERAVILSRDGPLRLDHALSIGSSTPPAATVERVLTDNELKALERENLMAALDRAAWRVSGSGGAAELLGVRPSTLRDRMKALGIRRST